MTPKQAPSYTFLEDPTSSHLLSTTLTPYLSHPHNTSFENLSPTPSPIPTPPPTLHIPLSPSNLTHATPTPGPYTPPTTTRLEPTS